MKKLCRTSLSLNHPNTHVLYLNYETGVGFCGMVDGHSHQVGFQPAVEEQVDPNTGEVIAPASPASFFLYPAEDGHSHDQLELPVSKKSFELPKENDGQIIAEVHSLLNAAIANEGKSRKQSEENRRFYKGEQWKPEDKQKLEDLGRACLTHNLIRPKIDELTGEERQNRTEFKYVPVEGSDSRACDMYNIVAKVIKERCRYDREKSKVFKDEVIEGRGLFNLRVDFSKNLEGDIIIERLQNKRVYFGPHEKEDLSDLEYLIKLHPISKAKLEHAWPDKADEVGIDWARYNTQGEVHVNYTGDVYAKSNNVYPTMLGSEVLVDIAQKQYTILECWRLVYLNAKVFTNYTDDFIESVYGWSKTDLKQLKSFPEEAGFAVVERPTPMIRITKIAGGVVLSDENPADLPVQDFFIVPAYCYKDDEVGFAGKVQDAIDCQREINKRRSQSIDIANKMGAYGWGYDDATFADSNEAEYFKKNSTSPGFVTKLMDTSRGPLKFEGIKFPSEIVELMQLDVNGIDKILNISPRDPGANTSAAAIMQTRQLKLRGNEFMFDNLSFAEIKLAYLLLHTMKRYFPPRRILRILNAQNTKSPFKVGGQEYSSFSEEEVIEILANTKIAEIDIAVAETSFSPTTRLGTLLMLQEWMRSGGQVPPKLFARFLDIPEEERQEMIADIEAQAEAANTQANQTSKTEILKTLVGNGIIPDEVKKQFGLDNMGAPSPETTPPTLNNLPNDMANGGLAAF